MLNEFDSKSRKRRLLSGLLCVLLFVPCILWALSNLFLLSPLGTGFLEKKLAQRSGLKWSVGGARWIPFGGIKLWDLEIEPSETMGPLVEFPEVEVHLYWQDLWKRKLNLESIEVHSPNINLDIETVRALMPEVSVPPMTSQSLGQRPMNIPGPSIEAGSQVDIPREKPPVVTESAPAEVKSSGPNRKGKPKRKAEKRPFLISMHSADFKLVRDDVEVLAVEGIHLKVPFIGERTEGKLFIKEIKLFEESIHSSLSIPTKSRGSIVTIEAQSVETSGVKWSWFAQANLANRLFQVSAAIPIQPAQVMLPKAISVRLKSLVAQVQLSGRLDQVRTWNGGAVVAVQEVKLEDRTGSFVFDQGEGRVFCQGGQILAPNIGIYSEDLSIMGNGFLQTNGFACGIVRLIGSPEAASSLKSRLHPGLAVSEWWQDYETPDRKFRDIRMEGPLGQWKVLEQGQWLLPLEWANRMSLQSSGNLNPKN